MHYTTMARRLLGVAFEREKVLIALNNINTFGSNLPVKVVILQVEEFYYIVTILYK